MTALLEIKNIETYYDLIYAIRGTSLNVDAGTITAILGTNGAEAPLNLKGSVLTVRIPKKSCEWAFPMFRRGAKFLKSSVLGKTC
jgi:hypothetical protein